jgi:formate dehydrogenase subunit beta
MNVNRILQIHDGDALKTLQEFLLKWWMRIELDAMLAPIELPDHSGVVPQIIERPDDLGTVNPFAPVMLTNAASMVADFVKDYPKGHLAVMLRPCELRALVELRKRNRVHFRAAATSHAHESLVILGVDCPGTFSASEYTRRVAKNQDEAKMIQVAMAYGSQDSYVPRQVRTACQLCDWSAPKGADITIGSIGIAPQGFLLVITQDENLDAQELSDITDGVATEQQVVCREMMVGKLGDKQAKKRAALVSAQSQRLEDFNSLLSMFARCTLCADCLDACPLYEGELAGMLGVSEAHQGAHPLLSELVGVSRWLASCSGCGMCQEACEQGAALTSLISVISHQIRSDLHYQAGNPDQGLPWGT